MKLRAAIERLEKIEQDLQAGLSDGVEPEVVAAIQRSYRLTALHRIVSHQVLTLRQIRA